MCACLYLSVSRSWFHPFFEPLWLSSPCAPSFSIMTAVVSFVVFVLEFSWLFSAQALSSYASRGSKSVFTSGPDPACCGRVCACDETLGLCPAQSSCAGLAGCCCLTVLVFVSGELLRPLVLHVCVVGVLWQISLPSVLSRSGSRSSARAP